MTCPAPVPPHRQQLRAATHCTHARLDARFAAGLRTPAAYGAYLLGMHAFVDNAERALARALPGADWQAFASPDRAGWLADDLVALGLRPLAPGPALAVRGDAEVAGLLYVIEGSALGATQLVPDALALGWSARQGAAFLHRHGGLGAGLRWRGFLQCLEAAPFEAAAQQAMLQSAARAFACADHEFERASLATGVPAGAC